jgi:hypothetical protein
MNTFLSIPKALIAISVTVVFLCGGIFLWQCCNRCKRTAKTDRQTVWLLIGLLIIAAISMGVFVFTIFTELLLVTLGI